ncbi:MAG: hypothetical protein ACR2NF_02360, partial [Pirellulales bacterium]
MIPAVKYGLVLFAVLMRAESVPGDVPPESPVIQLKTEPLGLIAGTKRWDWWQARTAYIPGKRPMWLTTMSETGKTTSHDFHDIFQSVSHDHGKTWSAAALVPSLQRRTEEEGYQVAPG